MEFLSPGQPEWWVYEQYNFDADLDSSQFFSMFIASLNFVIKEMQEILQFWLLSLFFLSKVRLPLSIV